MAKLHIRLLIDKDVGWFWFEKPKSNIFFKQISQNRKVDILLKLKDGGYGFSYLGFSNDYVLAIVTVFR